MDEIAPETTRDPPQRPAPISHMFALTTVVGMTLAMLRAKGALVDAEIEAIFTGTERLLPPQDREHGRQVLAHIESIVHATNASSSK